MFQNATLCSEILIGFLLAYLCLIAFAFGSQKILINAFIILLFQSGNDLWNTQVDCQGNTSYPVSVGGCASNGLGQACVWVGSWHSPHPTSPLLVQSVLTGSIPSFSIPPLIVMHSSPLIQSVWGKDFMQTSFCLGRNGDKHWSITTSQWLSSKIPNQIDDISSFKYKLVHY